MPGTHQSLLPLRKTPSKTSQGKLLQETSGARSCSKRTGKTCQEEAKKFVEVIQENQKGEAIVTWISVSERLPGEEDGSYQLVAYLEPSFGCLTIKYTTGFYSLENNDETGEIGGWLDWDTEKPILVTHWMQIPVAPTTRFEGMKQSDFKQEFNSFRPNFGNAIE